MDSDFSVIEQTICDIEGSVGCEYAPKNWTNRTKVKYIFSCYRTFKVYIINKSL